LLNRKNSEKGFTLIELLVVVVIIGILVAIALPTFLTQVNKARQSEARNYVATAGKQTQAYFLERNLLPPSTEEVTGAQGLAGSSNCASNAPLVGGFAANVPTRPGLFAEGGMDVCLKFYTVRYNPEGNGTAPSAPIAEYKGRTFAKPNRASLKGYANNFWAAQFPGSPVPEIFTLVGEQFKAGTVAEADTYSAAALALDLTTSASFEPSDVNANWFRASK
jgi:prepilin-type N-terminal cleavage/methylation domain-containing protein